MSSGVPPRAGRLARMANRSQSEGVANAQVSQSPKAVESPQLSAWTEDTPAGEALEIPTDATVPIGTVSPLANVIDHFSEVTNSDGTPVVLRSEYSATFSPEPTRSFLTEPEATVQVNLEPYEQALLNKQVPESSATLPIGTQSPFAERAHPIEQTVATQVPPPIEMVRGLSVALPPRNDMWIPAEIQVAPKKTPTYVVVLVLLGFLGLIAVSTVLFVVLLGQS
jgi:hypothetical protein